MSKRMYGGCKWSARTEPRRTIFALNDFPGPGSYDVNEKREDPAAELTARAREMAVGMSYNPRMMESIQNQTLREVTTHFFSFISGVSYVREVIFISACN